MAPAKERPWGGREPCPVTGTEQAQPAQAGRVVPAQGTGSFLHPCTRQGESQQNFIQ